MAIQFPGIPNFSGKGPDIAGAINEGQNYYQNALKSKFMPKKLENAQIKDELANKINRAKAQYAMQREAAALEGQNISNKYNPQLFEEKLKRSQFNSQNPLLDKTGAAGQIGALMYLQQHPEVMRNLQGGQNEQGFNNGQNEGKGEEVGQDQEPIDNPSYVPSIKRGLRSQNLVSRKSLDNENPADLLRQSILAGLKPKQKTFAPSNTVKELDALRDVEAGFIPGTDRTQKFETKDQQDYYANALREKVTGLKKGEHYIYDPETKEKIGIESPLNAKEAEVEKGRAFFNEVLPVIRKGSSEFSGKDSIKKLDYYASHYNDDPVSKQKIDDLILADMALSAGVINEAATLGGGRTNQTFNNLKRGLSSSDIPERLKKLELGFKIPSSAFENASKRFQDLMNSASTNSARKVPASKMNYFRPEKYVKVNKKSSDVTKLTDEELQSLAGVE